MKWAALIASLISFTTSHALPQFAAPDFGWWTQARFGMFVHWGLYAEAGGVWKEKFLPGWSEWMLNRKQIPPNEYHALLTPRFDPVDFDAEAWVLAAKAAGMKYIVITTKHHEGFALWPSAASEQDIAATPFGKPVAEGGRGRDPLRELATACKKHGIKLGFYYSLLDWSHPDYLPRREWDKRPTEGANYAAYTTFMRAQVKELLDGRYGEIAVLWGDGDWEHGAREHTSDEIVAMARVLQPNILVNDRWAQPGDFATPENKIPEAGPDRPWETCMTLNGSWGFARDDHDFKSAAVVLANLAAIVSKDGNYLVNIGPDGKGRIDPESMAVLTSIAEWMETHASSIHGNGRAPLPVPGWGKWTMAMPTTKGATTFNAHLLAPPASGEIRLAGVLDDPISVRTLGDEYPAPTVRRDGADVVLELPESSREANAKCSPHSVIAVEFASMPRILTAPVILSDDQFFIDRISLRFIRPPADALLHVTLDGSEPTLATSPIKCEESGDFVITLDKSATVRARMSWQGQLSSAETTRTFEKVTALPDSPCGEGDSGLSARMIVGEFAVVPAAHAFDSGTALPHATSVAIPVGVPAERFAVQLVGLVKAPVDGVYRFELSSDDGSELWIDDQRIVDNGGLHGAQPKTGDVALEAGCHEFEVRMFESVGSESLSLRWRVPKALQFTSIPASAFHRQ